MTALRALTILAIVVAVEITSTAGTVMGAPTTYAIRIPGAPIQQLPMAPTAAVLGGDPTMTGFVRSFIARPFAPITVTAKTVNAFEVQP